MDLVILSVPKKPVLHRDVSPFLGEYSEIVGTGDAKQGGVWVLRDEILRYGQNDKVQLSATLLL
jgi:hypothetical protein